MRQHCACRNEALQKLHTEQSLLLTARWKQNKITWQLLCSTLVQTVISLLVNRLQKHESSIKRHRDTPLESNFLNFCVAISWWSGSSEKIIWIISAVMTPSCTNASEFMFSSDYSTANLQERGSLHLQLWWVLWSWCLDLGSDIPAWSHQLKVCRHFFSWTAAVIQTHIK